MYKLGILALHDMKLQKKITIFLVNKSNKLLQTEPNRSGHFRY
jgi:hypothetical protein